MEEFVKKYFRFFLGNEVCLKGVYFVKCIDVIKDENGNVVEIYGIYDFEIKSGFGFIGCKVKFIIYWVDVKLVILCEFRLFELLIFDDIFENEGKYFLE